MADANHDAHKTIQRFESFWIAFSLALVVVFVVLVFHAVGMHGGQIGQAHERQDVETIMAMPEFADPGVRETGQDRYTASVVAQAFSFVPGEIVVPAGAEITFRLTSRDVIHGFQVKNTNINVELIPGEVAELRYTFREPGEYPLICNQYCGVAHHNMINMVRVVDSAEWMTAEADEVDEELEWEVRGQRVYGNQCAACHQADGQGVPGTFPPLAGHAPNLYLGEGGREYMIDVVLYGLAGPITVDGTNYSGMMPGMPRMSDADMAAVVNHMLHDWGNAAELPDDFVPVTAAEVAERRDRPLAPGDILELRPELD